VGLSQKQERKKKINNETYQIPLMLQLPVVVVFGLT
jgi:hypothetical protein